MIRCLTNKRGLSLTELMISVAITVILFTGVYLFYTTSSQSYTSGITQQSLQSAANTVLKKIMEGESESGTVYRLDTAVSYMIPNGQTNFLYTCGGAAQATPCNLSNTSSELYYCQDSPCTSSDTTARWYYLDSTGTAIYYHHPTSSGGTTEELLYKAPSGSTLSLRFSPAAVTIPANVVEIDVDLSKNVRSNVTNSRLTTTSGDVSTFILLRNHP